MMAAPPTSTPRPSRWPWIVFGIAASFAAIGLVFVSLNGYSLLGDATNFIAFMGMGVVGALSLSRAPDNRIGLLLLWVAITVGVAFTTGEASIYAADPRQPRPGGMARLAGQRALDARALPASDPPPSGLPRRTTAVASLAMARLGGYRRLVPRVPHDRVRRGHVRGR